MALSDTQKQNIIFFLGWPGKTIIADSINFNSGVESRLRNLTAEIESRVNKTVERLLCLDEKLIGASSRLAAKKVDTIETNPEEIPMLKSERRRLCRELSSILDIPYLQPSGGNMVNVFV